MTDTDVTDEKNKNQTQTQADSAEQETQSSQAPEAGREAELEAKLAEAEVKAQENWDQVLRARAEMDNLRRRTERELENAHKYALERFVQELLPVKDSLELGVQAAQADDASVDKIREGTELTLKMLETALDKHSVREVHPLDEPFNPELHQAMSMIEAPDKPANTVINVMQKGYTLNERLIRPAMVVVAKAPAAPQGNEPGANVDEQA